MANVNFDPDDISSTAALASQIKMKFSDMLCFADPAPFAAASLLSSNEPKFRLPAQDSVWQIAMRNSAPGSAPAVNGARPRNYLWIRRPVHRARRMRHMQMGGTLGEIKIIPAILLFSSCVGIAAALSVFIR
jgi:hypothetical protein